MNILLSTNAKKHNWFRRNIFYSFPKKNVEDRLYMHLHAAKTP